MRILYFWTSRKAARLMRPLLKNIEVTVDAVGSLADASEALAMSSYDLVILDVEGAPEMVPAATELFRRFPQPPRLVVGPEMELPTISEMLGLGAHDFLIKPFTPIELGLRMRLCAASAVKTEATRQLLEFGPLKLDVVSREVELDGKRVDLTPRERCVLEILMNQNGAAINKSKIAAKIFSVDEVALPQTIETYVYRLRKKLAESSLEVATIRGVGYRLRDRRGGREGCDLS